MLLDNGRTAVLADDGRAAQALHCIRCSACLNVCPVYERAGGHAYGSVYPGPIGAVLSPQLTGVGGQRLAAVRVVAVRGLLRRLPGAHRHPSDPRAPARGARRGATAVGACPRAEALGMAAAAWVMSDPQRFAAAEKATRAGRLARPGRGPDHHPAPAAVALDGQPRRPPPTRRDLPRVVGPRAGRRPMTALTGDRPRAAARGRAWPSEAAWVRAAVARGRARRWGGRA